MARTEIQAAVSRQTAKIEFFEVSKDGKERHVATVDNIEIEVPKKESEPNKFEAVLDA